MPTRNGRIWAATWRSYLAAYVGAAGGLLLFALAVDAGAPTIVGALIFGATMLLILSVPIWNALRKRESTQRNEIEEHSA